MITMPRIAAGGFHEETGSDMVVAAERRPQPLVVFHQEPRLPLEVVIRLPFLAVDRHRPAAPTGHRLPLAWRRLSIWL